MQTSNFSFLHDLFPVLENFGSLAEQYVYTDPNSCLLKLGMIGETIVRLRSASGKVYSGRGISTDIIGSSINAYVSAVNKIVYEEEE